MGVINRKFLAKFVTNADTASLVLALLVISQTSALDVCISLELDLSQISVILVGYLYLYGAK